MQMVRPMDPQCTLREIVASQDEFDKQFKELIRTAAPAIDLSSEKPLPNELLFSWQVSRAVEKATSCRFGE
jgi:hypothetical protein